MVKDNDYFEGQITENFTGAVNDTVDTKPIFRLATYKNNEYTFTSVTFRFTGPVLQLLYYGDLKAC